MLPIFYRFYIYEMNTSVQQECIKLIKSKYIYIYIYFLHLKKIKDHETLNTVVMAENSVLPSQE